ncbi:DUF4350 domain-containing protein [Dysgonomonas sp. 511]|uniref:DUF4350 domain-containing protein n=1 Tax=Dysgonomonas sp. 511 TaxID=2302930 RepID=UPI0013D0FDC9|nr:DUF4350 domain-containing protein [Dysgonomonas sp. 511]NDV77939.1 hypothetical protein [Dysgonomonas sp. 511]
MGNKTIIALAAATFLLLIGLSYCRSKADQQIDWSPNFYNSKTSPYGTYITYQLLEDIFNKKNIRATRLPIYNNLKNTIDNEIYYPQDYEYTKTEETYIADDGEADGDYATSPSPSAAIIDWYNSLADIKDTTSYVFINDSFEMTGLDREYLLDYAGIGNNIFISAETFDHQFLDTLGIKTKKEFFASDSVYALTDYGNRDYTFSNIYSYTKLKFEDCPYPVRVLATNSTKGAVFIRIKYGKGHIYLHTVPTAFTNINMLRKDKYDFGFRCLSYLPQNSKILWDEYQKQGMVGEGTNLKMMLAYPPLRIAWYIILAGLLLFMIFRSKRTQRIIPVINPPVNSSLEFLDVLSNLYYKKKDFHYIIEKRQAYLLDFIRKNYYMPTENIDEHFVSMLAAKSGMEAGKIKEMFLVYKDMASLAYIPNESFLKYNSLLEEFYKEAKNK